MHGSGNGNYVTVLFVFLIYFCYDVLRTFERPTYTRILGAGKIWSEKPRTACTSTYVLIENKSKKGKVRKEKRHYVKTKSSQKKNSVRDRRKRSLKKKRMERKGGRAIIFTGIS